jgi:integrase
MEKGIYKRGSIYWIRFAGLDGKIVRESTRSRRFQAAKDLLTKRREEVRNGSFEDVRQIGSYTFNDLADEYDKWAKRQRGYETIKKSIINSKKSGFSLRDKLGHKKLRSFNTKVVEHFQAELLESERKPSTVNRYLSCMKNMFTKAEDWQMVEESVKRKVHKVKILKEDNKRLRYLTIEEYQRLLDVSKPPMRSMIVIAVNTGIRKENIFSLKWDQIDFSTGQIYLPGEKTKNREEAYVP